MSKKKRMREEREALKSPAPKPAFKSLALKGSVILVAVLVIAAMFLRMDSFKKEHPLSFDESVYSFLAMQMTKAPGTYNTIAIYEDAARKGQKLPEYFKMPIFKHPPLFPWMISLSYSMFGAGYNSAFLVSLFMGALLIAAAYLLGSALFDERTGMVAAAVMFIEPVTWIASQKIWMETSLAFFTVLSLALFALNIRKYNPYLVLASGVSCGLAALCKYPGLLAIAVIFVYALLADRTLFKKKTFLASLALPFVILSPWLIWNLRVYGIRMDVANEEVAHIIAIFGIIASHAWWSILAAAILCAAVILLRSHGASVYDRFLRPRADVLAWVASVSAAAVFVVLTAGSIVKTLDLAYVPQAGWQIGMFTNAPWHFYLGRLIELSPFYIFTFLGFLLFAAEKDLRKQHFFLILSIVIILGLYVMWRNFQCRYITTTIVPLVVLAARMMDRLYVRAGGLKPRALAGALRLVLLAAVVYAAARTLNIDLVMAVPNGVCYF